ncbi:MAG TPA: uracil-DNA glycosylase family protein [Polyangiales bacterium]|nr:uracil-DNA glycosylase family protein [Polyangiales bacterium]
MSRRLQLLRAHQAALRACTRCPEMHRPAIVGTPVLSPILLVGQAPGDREPVLGRPFAWTAGKQLFKWFAPFGLDEAGFRERVYMAAVCRCFPGKLAKGGDRVPNDGEIERCRPWLESEIELLRPELIIPVGKLAIAQFLPVRPLVDQIGVQRQIARGKRSIDLIALPHPSGASTWPRIEPGKTLTAAALRLIAEHPAWRSITASSRAGSPAPR